MAGSARHTHYTYSLKYDDVSRARTEVKKCSAKNVIYRSQQPAICIEILHTKSINKQSSNVRKENRAKLHTIDHFFPAMEMERGLEQFKNKYLKEKDVERSLSKDVVPAQTFENFFDDCELNLYGLTINGQVSVGDLKRTMLDLKRSVLSEKKVVKEEVPLNRWLYEYICKTLDTSIFVVESKEDNIKDQFSEITPAEVNDYARSQAYLVIHKHIHLQKSSMKCATMMTCETLSGMVAELKLTDGTSYPVWECFHNMSGIGANIAMKGLSQGVIVDYVVVYGLVTQIDSQHRCRLLQLVLNFNENICEFKQCDGHFQLDLLLNAILAHL